MKKLFFVAFLILCSASALCFDNSSCQDSASKVARAARDLSDAAESVQNDHPSQYETSQISSALDDIEWKLRRARSDCEYETLAVRTCRNYREISRLAGIDEAKRLCTSNSEKYQPGLCSACLGK